MWPAHTLVSFTASGGRDCLRLMNKLVLPAVLSTLLVATTAPAAAEDPPYEPTPTPPSGPVEKLLPKLKPLAQAVAVDSEDRIVALGGSRSSSRNKPLKLARLLADGQRDVAFSGNGTFKTSFKDQFTGDTFIHDALAIDSEDRIYATVEPQATSEHVGLVRLLADGTLDDSWGTNGVAWLDFGREAHLTAVALNPAGGILVGLSFVADRYEAGEDDPTEQAAVAYLDGEGALDTIYGTDGTTTLPVGDRVDDIRIDSQGRAVVSTWNLRSTDDDMPIYRLLPSGELDPDFGDEGTAEWGGFYVDQEIVLDAEDRVIVTTTSGRSNPGVLVTRLTTDGRPDESYGDEGEAGFSLPRQIGTDVPVTLDGESRVVVGYNVRGEGDGDGRGSNRRSTDFALTRFDADGEVDDTLGEDGLLRIDFRGQKDRIAALATGLDGSLIASGGARVAGKRGLKGAVAVIPPDAE